MTHAQADSGEGRSPESVDRLMVGACGGIWLVFLVVAVVAAVALVNLGSGRGGVADNSSWLLYTIIAVSAVTILAAVPLLLRARREALAAHSAVAPVRAPSMSAAPEAPTEKIQVFGTAVNPRRPQPEPPVRQVIPASSTEVERQWLRGTASILGAMGLALIAVATATYLLAAGADIGAWVALGFGAVFTASMPAARVLFGRLLDEAIEGSASG